MELIIKYSWAIVLIAVVLSLVISAMSISQSRKNARVRMSMAWLNLTSLTSCDDPYNQFRLCYRLAKMNRGFLMRIGCPDAESLQQAACVAVFLRIEWLCRRYNWVINHNVVNREANLPVVTADNLERLKRNRLSDLIHQLNLICDIRVNNELV